MKVTIETAYQEKYLPSPKHRKYRTRVVEGEFEVEVAEITSAEAPIVLRVHDTVSWADGIFANDYRQYGDQLYTQSRRGFHFNCEPEIEGKPVYAHELHKLLYVAGSCDMEHDAVAQGFREKAAQWLIIDGILWKAATEPFYQIHTFGLGGNHGGTSLAIITRWGAKRTEDCFSALQEKEARKAALDIAEARGDTAYYSIIQDSRYRIEVLDPSAIRFQRDKDIYCVEKVVTNTVFVRACSYAEAVRLAKLIPDDLYKEQGASYRYLAETVSEEEWSKTGRPCYDAQSMIANTKKFSYKVEYSWQIDDDGSRITEFVVVSAEDCQKAVNIVREEHEHLEDMRVKRVWKDIHNSWWAVNAWH